MENFTGLELLATIASMRATYAKSSVPLLPEDADVLHSQEKERPEESETCCICLEKLSGNSASCNIGSCTHRIHSECWRKFLINTNPSNQKCPMCRDTNVKWPEDSLKNIVINYGNPVEDIMEKGPTWWMELSQEYLLEWYFQEDETHQDFKSRMEQSLQQAIEEGAIDPESEEDYDDMPPLIDPLDPDYLDEEESSGGFDILQADLITNYLSQQIEDDEGSTGALHPDENNLPDTQNTNDQLERNLLQEFNLEADELTTTPTAAVENGYASDTSEILDILFRLDKASLDEEMECIKFKNHFRNTFYCLEVIRYLLIELNMLDKDNPFHTHCLILYEQWDKFSAHPNMKWFNFRWADIDFTSTIPQSAYPRNSSGGEGPPRPCTQRATPSDYLFILDKFLHNAELLLKQQEILRDKNNDFELLINLHQQRETELRPNDLCAQQEQRDQIVHDRNIYEDNFGPVSCSQLNIAPQINQLKTQAVHEQFWTCMLFTT